jgi:hypothetical protein
MNLRTLAALLTVATIAQAYNPPQPRHARLNRRQISTITQPVSSLSSAPAASISVAPGAPSTGGTASASPSTAGLSSRTVPAAASPTDSNVPSPQGDVPPLRDITSGMPTHPTQTVTATYNPGATPPINGAPPLPTKCTSLLTR